MTSRRGSKWLPVIDEARCTGCRRCAEACGPRCLDMIDELAVLSRPADCGSEEHCIAPCEESAIRMAWIPFVGDPGRGKWRAGP